ncbi:MAG: CAP domain-containing protein [Candidatus Micrarchaeota archaeon]|nr:CAP domain-containing protein [Candidatus Micrarchaeota archaeon]
MKGFMNATALAAVITLLGALGIILYMASNLVISAPHLNTTTSTASYSTIPFNSTTTTVPETTNLTNSTMPSNSQLIQFTLNQINSERLKFGLANVTLSNVISGQQHATSMLVNNYFSHWDQYGMKPYMRYTLLGGKQAVDENVAYNEQVNETCLGPVCSIHQINVTAAITRMNNQMLYNDSLCCNNGHRNNTLDPNHNRVSIGIAYNKTNVYLVEDFVNSYITWLNNTPGIQAGTPIIYLNGLTKNGANFSFIQINYDPSPQNLSDGALSDTKSYDQGQPIAGVAYGPYYYQNVQTIYATKYNVRGNYFNVEFNMSNLIKNYSAGVYTLDLFLTNSTGVKFLGTTYSIFINSNGQPYMPNNV